jgi:dTDP-4-amino-4,6-dideoxygalactose transaminase
VTESISARLLRLPIYPSLTHEQQAVVIHTMQEFFASV